MRSIYLRLILSLAIASPAMAMDGGQYTNSKWKPWFDSLSSGKGACCSFADGVMLEDVDWEGNADGTYRVKVLGEWVEVPKDAVLTVPNIYGATVVWPYKDQSGVTKIRCFIAGAGG